MAIPIETPEERIEKIREAAYFRYVARGYEHGHDLEDWLAAEAEIEMEYGDLGQPMRAEEEPPEYEVQQSSVHGFREDDTLKRLVRQHPQRDIPRVEGVEPAEAPPRE